MEAPFPGWDPTERELGCNTHSSFSASGLWGHVTSSLRPLLLHLLTRNCELRQTHSLPNLPVHSSIPAVGRETGIHLPHPPGVHLRPSVSCFLPPPDSSPAHPGTAHRPILPASPPVRLVFILHPVIFPGRLMRLVQFDILVTLRQGYRNWERMGLVGPFLEQTPQ